MFEDCHLSYNYIIILCKLVKLCFFLITKTSTSKGEILTIVGTSHKNWL